MDDIEAIKREVREAYARTAELRLKGIDFADTLPNHLRGSDLLEDGSGQLACWQKTVECLGPKTSERYLDLGCGGGLYTYGLFRLPCKYYGIDFCPELVDQLNRSLSKEKLTNVISVIKADADSLPYNDRFFDLATCIGLLEYYPSAYRHQVLCELRRVLKHNGRAAVDYPNPLSPRIQDAMEIEAFRGSKIILEDLGDVERGLAECGFDILDRFSHRVMTVYIISPHMDWSQWGIT